MLSYNIVYKFTIKNHWFTCRTFYHAGPTASNSFPDELRNSDSFDGIKRFLKTIIFSRYCVTSAIEVF